MSGTGKQATGRPGEGRVCYADLHVHLGASGDQVVKVSASRNLTLRAALRQAAVRKGLDILGIVDCASPPVMDEMKRLLDQEIIAWLDGGGYIYRPVEDGHSAAVDGNELSQASLDSKAVLLVPAVEMETREETGSAHFLAYFGSLDELERFARYLNPFLTNPALSTQQSGLAARDLQPMVLECGGLFVPAHAFTPHKGVYGSCYRSLSDCLPEFPRGVAALELGLSADTGMADLLIELAPVAYLSNSDAHSLKKMGREFNALCLQELIFDELATALQGTGGRGIVGNYGLHPALGKYHRSYCPRCCQILSTYSHVVESCPQCGSLVVTGVYDRLMDIADGGKLRRSSKRPPYTHIVPLEDIPGLGPRGVDKLVEAFSSEIDVLLHAEERALAEVIGERLASRIVAVRKGEMTVEPGGGGRYGRVHISTDPHID